MSFAVLGFILDIIVLAALGATMYFAIRLSKNLNIIKTDKKQMGELIAALSLNVDRANAASMGMRATATKTAEQLQVLITEAKSISEELQIMNEAGNSLAERLEKGATKTPASRVSSRTTETASAERAAPSAFFIHDRDYEEGRTDDKGWDEDDEKVPDNLQTQAERELYAAIRKNKKSPASGRH